MASLGTYQYGVSTGALYGGTGAAFRAMMAENENGDDAATMKSELSRLKQEHRDLDSAIDALEKNVVGDQLQIQRLKKRKLVLRDRISFIEDELTPDIIA